MKITNKMISIPPYLSTSWKNVHTVHMTDGVLVVTLSDGEAVFVPDLTLQEIDLIFKAHAAYLELQLEQPEEPIATHAAASANAHSQGITGIANFLQAMFNPAGATEMPSVRIAFGNLENMGAMMQHDSSQANSPDLPGELLEKITSLTKMLPLDDPNSLPKAEPHCNCFHCQVARTLGGMKEEPAATEAEPEIRPEELRFEQWEIVQTGHNLYSVTSKLDREEKYNVYLGEPVGCTCGKPGCEHIVAVLHS